MPIPESMEHKTIPTKMLCPQQETCGWAASKLCGGHHDEPHTPADDCNKIISPCMCVCEVIEYKCLPDCPQCLNIAWAKWILANVDHRAHEVTDLLALKKLAGQEE